ncbi:aldehyde dehydrogenase family protein [Euzebya rosea]|uniref:aldehyde dehydrogenase family protein n=1 Tax=Euzebya rosea TaxID=2052804 RepID=UPI000D3E5C2D|nr:aldehyde dehydrogenase family protein [Euzebya rosea]
MSSVVEPSAPAVSATAVSAPALSAAAMATWVVDAAWEDGDRIVTAGDPGDSCLFLDDGVVRLEVPGEHLDTDVVLGYLDAGEILGEIGLLDGRARSATAIAEGPVRGRWLTRDALSRMTTEAPGLAVEVVRTIATDLAGKLRATSGRLASVLESEAPDLVVEETVARGVAAQHALDAIPEDVMDAVLADLATAFGEASAALAARTVEVTHIGRVDHKTMKNAWAALGVHHSMQGAVGRGPLGDNDTATVTDVAAPVGVVFAIIPVTNPVATAMFKVLSALRSGNAIILSFHRICLPLADEVGAIAHAVLGRHGLPVDAVQWVRERASRQRTARFMAHPDVALVLATGGPGMVRAAYSSGTPAIGVGPGNTPCWVAADADLDQAAGSIIASKSFDNGLICGAEHNLVVDATVVDGLLERLASMGAAVLDDDEATRFVAAVVTEDGAGFRPEVLGQSAQAIAGFLGIERPHEITVLVFRAEPDLSSPVTSEKLSPFLPVFTVDGDEEALALCLALLDKMGTGHTAIVHTASEVRIATFADAVPASRILVNSPGSQGVCGLTTDLPPTLTLGCGTFGGNSTTDNVTWANLRNVKRIARVTPPHLDPILHLL